MSNVAKLSVVSGLFAASAAGFGKLATSPSLYSAFIGKYVEENSHVHQTLIWSLQGVFFLGMLLTNMLMWSQFSMALSLSQTTIYVIVINTISNFICTAIIGLLLFGERITLMWAVGIVCLLIGTALLKDQTISQTDINKQQ